MYTIAKQFAFSASHQLHNVPPGHPCGRLHGHNYTVEVEVSSHKLENQWVLDFGMLSKMVQPIIDGLDHQNITYDLLYRIFGGRLVSHETESTSENLAALIFTMVSLEWDMMNTNQGDKKITAVTVSETTKTRARFSICLE